MAIGLYALASEVDLHYAVSTRSNTSRSVSDIDMGMTWSAERGDSDGTLLVNVAHLARCYAEMQIFFSVKIIIFVRVNPW